MKNKLSYCDLRFVFQTKCKISNFFRISKGIIPLFWRFCVAYKFQCGDCRMCEHLGISVLTVERVKGDGDSAVKEYLLACNYAHSHFWRHVVGLLERWYFPIVSWYHYVIYVLNLYMGWTLNLQNCRFLLCCDLFSLL